MCVKSITNYLNKFSDGGLETKKSIWKFIKPFLTKKGTLTDYNITILDGKKIILDDFELAKTFNNQYINTVEINSGFEPLKTTNQSKDDFSVIDEIICTYRDHPSVKQISSTITTSNTPKAKLLALNLLILLMFKNALKILILEKLQVLIKYHPN